MIPDSFEQLNDILRAYRKSNVLFVAYELGVLDIISEKSVNVEIIEKELGLSNDGLNRLLSALCAMGIIKKENNNYTISRDYDIYLNPLSSSYIGSLINHEIHLHKRWTQLSTSIKSGMPVKNTDEPIKFEDTQRFIKAMANIGQRTAPILLEKVNFNGNEHLLDLGGGPGKYIEKFCDKYPDMQLVLFDQPETIRAAQSALSKHKCYKNIKFISGDFLENILGKEYDIIFSSNVIHIFGPKDVKIIFDKCYQALKSGGRLLIKDFFLNDEYTGPVFTTLFSLHMLLSTNGGRCYSEKELISLMENSNFAHGQTINLTESSMVVEGIK
jgi:ubiquinone/menaquinone biosynthesis C-methylase UbiE/predicted transcriptional regulator